MDGQELRTIRQMLGLSQRALAKRLYYGRSAMSLMEQNGRRVPARTAKLVWEMLGEHEAAIHAYREQHDEASSGRTGGQKDTPAA